jgi:murein L,D-transpeptidase YafK
MKLQYNLQVIGILAAFPVFANTACILPTGLNVQSIKRTLKICDNGKVISKYKISIGRAGIEKRIAGDKKTPTGLYELSSPRKSNKFGIFIPIQYPTIQQSAAGYTGKDVGIHGPFQLLHWLGSINTWFNWTQGCIAVANNNQISFIAKWVETHPKAKVFIY